MLASLPIQLLLLQAALILLGVLAAKEGLPSSEATIAFHVSVTESQLPLLQRFFSRIYHPRNLYLVTFAPPLSARRHAWRAPGRNVHFRAADPYVEHGVSEVINVLDGMVYFLDREDALSRKKSFDYYIHCTPTDYPVVTPAHMRAILGFAREHAHPPSFFHFADESQLPSFRSEIDRVYFDYSLTFNRSLTLEEGLDTHNNYHPDYKRRTHHISRTEKHFVAHRNYVKFAADSMLSKRLLMSLGDASHVFERFFGSLASNAGLAVGNVIRSTSLHCTRFSDNDRVVNHILPRFVSTPPSVEFLRRSVEPCLFTGPFRVDEPQNLSIRDQIDKELLIAPGTQGKPDGPSHHTRVYEKLKKFSS